MRLLLRNNTGEISLTRDLVGDDLIPPYAILSHTWKEGQEVTFKDLMDGTGKSKSGYDKIRFCGQQAKRDGLQYFWVDTCCIDKSNHAELQEAINSMFRWYQNAAKCYVYLSDVSKAKRKASDQFSEFTWEPAFRGSRWFIRGWTLQELLAPDSVEFFSLEGKQLGSKRTLERQIHEITGIAVLALRGSPLSKFSVEERLSWARYRETTRKEDKAYSLLGIFDIFMPLIYGEGEEHAFKRLRKKIDKPSKGKHRVPANIQRGLKASADCNLGLADQIKKEDQECIQHLRLTDPRDDKKRIEETKGGLLEDSYHWILENSDFQKWRNDQQSRLLWIKGDPGKGKTMLLCGIVNELKKSIAKTDLLSYFFCQATDSRIKNATAVLRGLTYLLVDQQPSLISHIQKKYDHAGKTLFEDTNAWSALSEIFTNILHDPSFNSTYLIIDALDECETGLPQLLELIVQNTPASPHVKWIVSSRNKADIEARLRLNDTQMRLSLELNAEHVSRAVEMFIDYKVSQLASIKHDNTLKDKVRNQMHEKANGTFLWVALVFQELEQVDSWDVLQVLKEVPAGLQPLYDRMMSQVQQLKRKDPEFCRLVLSTMTLAYRPLHLLELGILSGLPVEISSNLDSTMKIVGKCGSFLTIREDCIYFIHQSAKDYLDSNKSEVIFPSGRGRVHYDLFSRSLEAMSGTLQRDMYALHQPGISIDSAEPPHLDPLAPVRYSCVYWASHFDEAYRSSFPCRSDLTDCGKIHLFLQRCFLYWLEALSLMRSMSSSVETISTLLTLLKVSLDFR